MSECPQLNTCPIWEAFQGPVTTAWINSYCRGPLLDRCARMWLQQADKPVPLKLLPNGTMLPEFYGESAQRLPLRSSSATSPAGSGLLK